MVDVCVVGGSGFIGTAVARRLQGKGVPFKIVDRRESITFPSVCDVVDIRDAQRLRESIAGSSVMHLAAVHRDDVRPISLYHDVNVQGTSNLCDAAEAAGIERIIFASSVAVYGFAPVGTDERGEIAPFNDYGRTKAEGEDVLRAWQARDSSRRSLTIIRPTVVFGPGNRGNVYNLFKHLAQRRFVMIGDGRNCKSLAYIDNVADFFLHFLDAPPGVRTYNYIDGPEMNMNELVSLVRGKLFNSNNVGIRVPKSVGYLIGAMADLVASTTGRNLPISSQRVLKFVSSTAFASCHKEEHGFVPPVDLRQGIEETLIAEFISPDPDRPVFETE